MSGWLNMLENRGVLISHRYRFIYTKTVKTAGTSVEAYFERFCMPEGEWQPSHPRQEYESPAGVIGYRGSDPAPTHRWYNHMPAELIRQRVGADVWNSYFKFCVIRDPFEKAISAFEHFGKDHAIPRGPRGLWFRLRHRPYTPEQRRFLHWLTVCGPSIDRDKYMIGSVFCLDDVIRYESLETDLERICDRIGVPWDRSQLPRFKSGIRRPTSVVSELYTPPAARLIESAYAFEIATFGYRSLAHRTSATDPGDGGSSSPSAPARPFVSQPGVLP